MDLSTLENRLKTKRSIQFLMCRNVKTALYARQNLNKIDRPQVLIKIEELQSIKYQIEATAGELGYSMACRSSIPVCQGDCCKWHFPKRLSYIDFFIAVYGLSFERCAGLIRLMNNAENKKYQCPLLLEEGCFFSFEHRPIVCTVAYPCFAGQSYWEYRERKKIRIHTIYESLERVLKPIIGNTSEASFTEASGNA